MSSQSLFPGASQERDSPPGYANLLQATSFISSCSFSSYWLNWSPFFEKSKRDVFKASFEVLEGLIFLKSQFHHVQLCKVFFLVRNIGKRQHREIMEISTFVLSLPATLNHPFLSCRKASGLLLPVVSICIFCLFIWAGERYWEMFMLHPWKSLEKPLIFGEKNSNI